MIKKKVFLIASLVMGAALVGGTFAAYAVTDNADPFNIKVTPGSLPTGDVEGYVTLEWGETKTLQNVEDLAMNTLVKVGEIGVKATGVASYTGVFSVAIADTTVRDSSYTGAKLIDLLELSVYSGKVAVEEVGQATKINMAETSEDSNVYAAQLTVPGGVERVLSVFVKIATEDTAKYAQIKDDVVDLTFNWDKAAGDLSASVIYWKTTAAYPHAYAWLGEDGTQNAEWPGEAMTKVEDGLYSYALSYAFDNVIFSDNGNNQSVDQLVTNDIRANTPVFNGTSWEALEGGEGPEPVVGASYYLAGTFSEWKALEQYKLAENKDAEGEWYILDVEIPANAELKVCNPALGDEGWYAYTDSTANFIIEQAGHYDFYFRPEGNQDWDTSLIWCGAHQEEPTSSEEQPSVPPATSEEPVVENAYYLVGSFTEWKDLEAYKLEENKDAEGEYFILDVEIPANSELKIHNPSLAEDKAWFAYSDSDANFTIVDAGHYDFYFRPEGNQDWDTSFIWCAPHQQEQASSEEQPSVPPATSEEPTSEQPQVEEGFYLVGSFNEWTASEEFKLAANTEAEGEYYIHEVEIPANSELKILDVANNKWYAYSDSDANFTITDAGVYDFYFNPNGNQGWDTSFIWCAPHQA